MRKVLLTWEGGAYLGHEMLVTSAALLLQGAGHEVVVYAPHGKAANGAARSRCVRWESTPPAPEVPIRPAGVSWRSRATSLWNLGFHSKEVVRDRFEAWDVIFEREQPDIALLQAAPFAQVMAHIAGYPSVEFGLGFDVPPQASPFPPFRFGEEYTALDALRLELAIMDRVASVFPSTRSGGELHAAVSGHTRLVTTVRELDHYDGCADKSRHFVGPLPVVELNDVRPRWRQRGHKILAYVRAELLDAASLLHAIAKTRSEAVVVCLGANDETVALASQLGIRLYLSPVSLGDLLAETDVVIAHGGGLMSEALIRGCVCVALPSHYEQFMTAKTLQRRGLGVIVNPKEPRHYEAAIRHALLDKDIRRKAAALGTRYRALASRPGADFLTGVESAIERAQAA